MTAINRLDIPQRYVEENKAHGSFRVRRESFVDPEILNKERDLIFNQCWLYIGHSSELPKANDFLTRSVGGRELIFNRNRKGEFQALYNVCPHRGAMVAHEPCGNAIAFKCFYHGWAFNNNGRFAMRMQDNNYPQGFGKDGSHDLVAVPKLAEYRDFWFVNFDAGAIDLEEYLADSREMIDVIADHSPEGMEIIKPAQKYCINANWKLLVENSVDGYHAHETHSTYIEYLGDAIGGPPVLPTGDGVVGAFDLKNGHSVIQGPAPWGRPVAQWIPAWGEQGKKDIAAIFDELVQRVGAKRAEQIALKNRNMSIFPNLVINDIMSITVRTFYPERHDYMTVEAWALGAKGEGELFRKRRLDNFLEFLGPGGFATPDDVEALESAQRGYRNYAAAPWNDLSKGMLKDIPAGDDEEQMRCFWREWSRRIEGEKGAGTREGNKK